jgi:anti-anti-sigma factor
MSLFIEIGSDGSLIVRGEVDLATADDLERAAIEAPGDRLVLDFRDVTFIDSSGIRALVRVAKRSGARIVIRDPAPRVERLFRLVGLDRKQAWTIERTLSGGPGA